MINQTELRNNSLSTNESKYDTVAPKGLTGLLCQYTHTTFLFTAWNIQHDFKIQHEAEILRSCKPGV